MLKFLDPSRNRHAGLIFAACVLCGPLALAVGGWAAWIASSKQPLPEATYIRLNAVTKQVELFGDRFIRLALTGSGEQDRKTLASMVTDPRAVSLPPRPWNITSTAVVDVERKDSESDSAEWKVVLQIGYAAPGTGAVQFTNMKVMVLSSGGAYKAAALPMLDTGDVVPMEVGPGYTIQVSVDNGLGDTISGFVKAYYVPGSNNDLGRYVTGGFTGKPVTSSPFTSTTVEEIKARSAPPQAPAPGDSVDVLATVRGGASETTWFTMQVPLKVVFTDQKQWAIKNILETIDVGKIIHR